MIIVWLIAAISGVSFFFLFLPHGWIAALIGASLCGSGLTALVAVALAWLKRPSPGQGAGAPQRDAARRVGQGRAMERSEGWPS